MVNVDLFCAPLSEAYSTGFGGSSAWPPFGSFHPPVLSLGLVLDPIFTSPWRCFVAANCRGCLLVGVLLSPASVFRDFFALFSYSARMFIFIL